jgi:signal transduction histidine kinase/CheY-like chemotaxis protein
VAQAGYAEVRADDEFVQVEGAWDNGNTPSLAGVHRLEDFGASLIADLRRDRVVSVNDVRSDPRTSNSKALQSFAKIQTRSFLDVPLFKGGRLIAYLFVSDSKPRLWSSYDVDLLRELAERLWSALERTCAQAETELERKRSEVALRNWNARLETRVAEEVAAREAAQHILAHAQRMEGLGQLAGGIAHDFNNVLQAVVGGLDLIGKRADDPEAVRQLTRMAAEATERGVSITSRLLAFSRKSELIAGPVRTLGLLENLQEILESTLGTGITIRIEGTPDTPSLMVDKAQLETVLINLAINARDAMPEGGSIVLAARSESVELGTAHQAGLRPGSYVRLEVIDTGVGMNSATLARASEPFFSTKEPGQGTGLGLAMARGFAQQSGGGFVIRSTLDKGTTVTLWFPDAMEAAEAADNRVEQGESSIENRLCALVVDDDRMVREMLAAQLKQLGFEILEASDGLAALARLDSEERIDLLVTDYAMPGMNGLILSREARQRRTQLPVLLLTGYVETHMQANFKDIEASGIVVIRKPVLPNALGKVAVELVASARTSLRNGKSSAL